MPRIKIRIDAKHLIEMCFKTQRMLSDTDISKMVSDYLTLWQWKQKGRSGMLLQQKEKIENAVGRSHSKT